MIGVVRQKFTILSVTHPIEAVTAKGDFVGSNCLSLLLTYQPM